jgi:hypothetical protein
MSKGDVKFVACVLQQRELFPESGWLSTVVIKNAVDYSDSSAGGVQDVLLELAAAVDALDVVQTKTVRFWCGIIRPLSRPLPPFETVAIVVGTLFFCRPVFSVLSGESDILRLVSVSNVHQLL